ncbi:hypothetical protein CP556_09250 [Natrinema sp. CBA1119]|nr:hypothetical protein CP556_09250 [Natrinema sp. CBA1119]
MKSVADFECVSWIRKTNISVQCLEVLISIIYEFEYNCIILIARRLTGLSHSEECSRLVISDRNTRTAIGRK